MGCGMTPRNRPSGSVNMGGSASSYAHSWSSAAEEQLLSRRGPISSPIRLVHEPARDIPAFTYSMVVLASCTTEYNEDPRVMIRAHILPEETGA